MINRTYWRLQFLLFLLSLSILSSSFYFQYVDGLIPCSLCLIQRFCVFLLVMIGFFSLCSHQKAVVKGLIISQSLIALAGMLFAARKLWLQSLPVDKATACLPGLDILIRYFSWADVFHALFWGSVDCAEVGWTWLGLSMSAWSGLYFFFMFCMGLFNLWFFCKKHVVYEK